MNDQLTANEQHELRILELVEEQDKVTQRRVAAELEVAIGMANSLIKRLIHKGHIKIKEAPASRYGYYLTPEGFLAKSRLVSKYIATSVKFFSVVRHDYEQIANELSRKGQDIIGCAGSGEILEIAQMVFQSHNIRTVFVVDVLRHLNGQYFTSYSDVPEADREQACCIVLTESQRPHRAFDIISSEAQAIPVMTPAFMKISKSGFAHMAKEEGRR